MTALITSSKDPKKHAIPFYKCKILATLFKVVSSTCSTNPHYNEAESKDDCIHVGFAWIPGRFLLIYRRSEEVFKKMIQRIDGAPA